MALAGLSEVDSLQFKSTVHSIVNSESNTVLIPVPINELNFGPLRGCEIFLVTEIGTAIENLARKSGLRVVPAFTGHGIGRYFHGPPDIYHCR